MVENLPEYSFEQKARLSKRIQKIKKHKNLAEIEQIIIKYNPDINITTNSSGKFLYFQDLKKETYYILEKYIKKMLKTTLSDASESTYSIVKYSDDDDGFSDARYSNKEKNIIKRKIYDEQVNENNVFAKRNK